MLHRKENFVYSIFFVLVAKEIEFILLINVCSIRIVVINVCSLMISFTKKCLKVGVNKKICKVTDMMSSVRRRMLCDFRSSNFSVDQ